MNRYNNNNNGNNNSRRFNNASRIPTNIPNNNNNLGGVSSIVTRRVIEFNNKCDSITNDVGYLRREMNGLSHELGRVTRELQAAVAANNIIKDENKRLNAKTKALDSTVKMLRDEINQLVGDGIDINRRPNGIT